MNSSRYTNLEAALDEGQSYTYELTLGGSNRAWDFIASKKLVSPLSEALAEDGFRKFRFVGSGSNAIILETSKGQVLRFRGPRSAEPTTGEPPDIDQMILPFYQREVEGVRVVGLNKLPTLDKAINDGAISRDDATVLLNRLRIAVAQQEPPCIFKDWKNGSGIKFEQVGLLPDLTPVFVDMGSVIEMKKLESYPLEYPDALKEVEELRSMPLPPIPKTIQWDGKWRTEDGTRKTEHYFAQVKEGATKDVVTAKEMDKFRSDRDITQKGQTVFEKAIEGDKLYLPEFGELAAKAAEKFPEKRGIISSCLLKVTPGKQKGFCQEIEKARVARANRERD